MQIYLHFGMGFSVRRRDGAWQPASFIAHAWSILWRKDAGGGRGSRKQPRGLDRTGWDGGGIRGRREHGREHGRGGEDKYVAFGDKNLRNSKKSTKFAADLRNSRKSSEG